MHDGKFVVRTRRPNVRVSWELTGTRDDPYAAQNPLVPQRDKRGAERGRCLNPDAYGSDARAMRPAGAAQAAENAAIEPRGVSSHPAD